MLERLARAIAKDRMKRGLPDTLAADAEFEAAFDARWAGSEPVDERQRANYRADVLALLTALRSPSEGMCWRGSIALQDWYDGKLDGPNATSEACWQRMIDYILNEDK